MTPTDRDAVERLAPEQVYGFLDADHRGRCWEFSTHGTDADVEYVLKSHADAKLQAAVVEFREALRPFADAIKYVIAELPDDYNPGWAEFFTYGNFRRAAAAFTPAPTDALERAIEAERREEREACAALCDGVKDKAKGYGIPQMAMGAIECADLIRARSDAQTGV